MTGWRIGYAVGNKEAISKLKKMKNNIDSGVFTALQIAGIEVLDKGDGFVKVMLDKYAKRREIVRIKLNELGWQFQVPQGAFYIWIEVPKGYTSKSLTEKLLDGAGVVVAPGSGYGEYGEGYIRISLTVADYRLVEAFERIKMIVT